MGGWETLCHIYLFQVSFVARDLHCGVSVARVTTGTFQRRPSINETLIIVLQI